MTWKHEPGGTRAHHWIDLVNDYGDGTIFETASIKWDGCIHFNKYANVPYIKGEDRSKDPQALKNYLHICDIDDMIASLESIKKLAKEHFGENWPDL